MAFICNFITVSIYWPFLHPVWKDLDEFQGEDKVWIRFHMYWVHAAILPACLINMYCSNCVLRRSTWKAIAFWSALFAIMLGAFTRGTGIVLYWFLSFQDLTTFLVIGLLLTGAIGVHFLAVRID